MVITQTGTTWIVTCTRPDGSQFSSILNNGTLDEVHAFVTALVDPTYHFRIEEVGQRDA